MENPADGGDEDVKEATIDLVEDSAPITPTQREEAAETQVQSEKGAAVESVPGAWSLDFKNISTFEARIQWLRKHVVASSLEA